MRAMIKPVLTVFALLLMIEGHVSGNRCHIPVLCNGGTTPAWVEVPEASEQNPEMAAEAMKALKSRNCTELTDLTARIDALGKIITTLSQQVVAENPTSTVTGTADHATPTDEPANTDRTKEIPSTSQRSESKSTTQVNPETTSIWEIFITKPQTTMAAGTQAATTATLADETITTSKDFCMLQYNDTCFWFKLRQTNPINFMEAEEICAERGSKPANLYNQNQYHDMMDLIRQNISVVDSSAQVWTGMTINPATKEVSFNNGTSALFVAWAKNQPNSISTRTKIAVTVARDRASTSQGIFNTRPGRQFHGVICERQRQI